MINFDEKKMLENGAYIYNQRERIENIADQVCNNGFENIFISSVGGSQAMMEPFEQIINEMSSIPVYSVLASTLVYTGHNQLCSHSLVFMASKSGDTKETVAAAKYVKEKGCTIVSIIGKEDSILEELSDYSVIYKDGRP